MTEFEPELGQAAFSNSPWGQVASPAYVSNGICLLADIVSGGDYFRNPSANVGPDADFDNGTFQIRAYCWCEGETPQHADGCPPNFVFGDFEARWYKHAQRGASQNRELSREEWTRILRTCLASIQVDS